MTRYTNTPAEVSRMTYATPQEVRRMRRLRESVGVAQKTIAHSMWIPLRTWQAWEAYGDRQRAADRQGSPMYRIIWMRAMSGLEAAQARPAAEAEAQARRAAAGLEPLDP